MNPKAHEAASWDEILEWPGHRLLGLPQEQGRALAAMLSLFHADSPERADENAVTVLKAGVPCSLLLLETAAKDRPMAFDAVRKASGERAWWNPCSSENTDPPNTLTPLELSLLGMVPAWVVYRALEDGLDPTTCLPRHPHPPKFRHLFGKPREEPIRPLAVAVGSGAFEAAHVLWDTTHVGHDADSRDEALLWLASVEAKPGAAEWARRLLEAGADANRPMAVLPYWAMTPNDALGAEDDTSGRRWAHRVAVDPTEPGLPDVWKAVSGDLRPDEWPVLGDDALALAFYAIGDDPATAHTREAMDVLAATRRPTTAKDTLCRALDAILSGELAAAQTQDQREELVGRLQEVRARPEEEIVMRALAAANPANHFWPLEWAVAHTQRPLTLENGAHALQRTLSKPSQSNFFDPSTPGLAKKPFREWARFMSQEDAVQWKQLLDDLDGIRGKTPLKELTPAQKEAIGLLLNVGEQPTQYRKKPRL